MKTKTTLNLLRVSTNRQREVVIAELINMFKLQTYSIPGPGEKWDIVTDTSLSLSRYNDVTFYAKGIVAGMKACGR